MPIFPLSLSLSVYLFVRESEAESEVDPVTLGDENIASLLFSSRETECDGSTIRRKA